MFSFCEKLHFLTMNKILIVLFLLLLTSGQSLALHIPGKIKGLVFLDKNSNGIRDTGEKGIKDIPVSNGDTIILTGRKGQFVLDIGPGYSVFPIIPSGLQLSQPAVRNAGFFYFTGDNGTPETIEFPLSQYVSKSKFRIGVIGDLQVGDREEVSYANRTVIPELAQRKDLDFTIFMGDLVNERMDLLKDVREMMETLPSHTWTVFGNHDRDIHAGKQDSVFNTLFGATHYSFNHGKVHFIILNNIWSTGKRSYEGKITDRQLRFITNDLSLVPADRLVVICQHIPLVHEKNKEQLLALLQDRKQVLILSGHTHQVSRHFPASNVTELVTGASCGNWWVGEKNWQGIPAALMQCGSPRNYFVIDFEGSKFKFSFKGIGLDENRQMDIHLYGQDLTDPEITGLPTPDRHPVIANIYGGSDSTIVRMQIDSGEWITMKKMPLVDPNVNRMIILNKVKAYPTTFSKKAALRQIPSPHIWIGDLPDGLKKGIHQIKIKAYDRYGFSASESRLIQISGQK